MAKAKKLPSGRWNVKVYSGTDAAGKRKYESFTADTKKEAEFLAAEYATKRSTQKVTNITVQEALQRYVDAKDGVLSPATIRGYRAICAHHLQPLWDVPLTKLTSEAVQIVIARETVACSAKSVANMYGLLTAALRMFAPNLHLSVSLPQKKRRQATVPVDEQIKQLLALAQGKPIELPIILAAMGGLRQGEIAALTVGDVCSTGVRVNKSMVRNQHQRWEIKQVPKTEAGDRIAPLPPAIVDRLREIGTGKAPTERLFECSPQTIYKRYAALRVQCGMDKCRFHDLRHYYASMAHVLGIPDQYIMLYGGWRDKGTLTRIYQHAQGDRVSDESQKLTGYFSSFF